MTTLHIDHLKAEAEARRLRAEYLADLLADLLVACGRPLRRALARVKARIAMGRAEAYLRTLPDAALKDMGITRGDIPMAVRHGRDALTQGRMPASAEPRPKFAATTARWA